MEFQFLIVFITIESLIILPVLFLQINFTIPKSVVKRIKVLLQDIVKTNEGKQVKEQFITKFGHNSVFSNIDSKNEEPQFKTPPPVHLPEYIPFKKENDQTPISYPDIATNVEVNAECSKKSIIPSFTSFTAGAASSTSDFIEVTKEDQSHSSDLNMQSLRPYMKDFKFGYEDIIHGTFEEKLDECLGKRKSLDVTETCSLNEAFFCEYEEMVQRREYQEMLKFRKQLPTYKKTAELLNVIKNNQVVVISGETGCGKSTQVSTILNLKQQKYVIDIPPRTILFIIVFVLKKI